MIKEPTIYNFCVKNLIDGHYFILSVIHDNYKGAYEKLGRGIAERGLEEGEYEIAASNYSTASDLVGACIMFLTMAAEKHLDALPDAPKDLLDMITKVKDEIKQAKDRFDSKKSTPPKSITRRVTRPVTKPKEDISPRTHLMRKIIKDRDVELFNKRKKDLTKNEIKYIKEKLHI